MSMPPPAKNESVVAVNGVLTPVFADLEYYGPGMLYVAAEGAFGASFEVAFAREAAGPYIVNPDLGYALENLSAGEHRHAALHADRPAFIRVRATGLGGDTQVTVQVHRPTGYVPYSRLS